MKTVQIKNSDKRFTVGKIVCVGRNYAEHAKELGNEVADKPVIFLKPSSAIIYSGESVVHPDFGNDLHHEIELVLLIGNDIKNASLKEAEDSIVGYGAGLDMTLRDVQNALKKKGDPWTIAKCFDTSAVLSDFVLKETYTLTQKEKIELKVNRQVKQNDTLDKMISSPAKLVQYISSLLKLEEGDLIFTGTPAGVSKVNRGDKLEGSIENIGELNCAIK
jgi:2-keto-4-pentenoate hydratase/2-oxohepta-3-ene-1,7-dioic acid hydratase in catechol pathway